MNHNFNEKVIKSESGERIEKDITILEKAFPNALAVLPYLVDENDKGVDYFVIFPDGQTKYIDVKARERGVSKYWKETPFRDSNGKALNEPELTLEMWSNKEAKVVGWTFDTKKMTDYILYVFDEEDCPNAYLIPFKKLQETFKANYKDWIAKYGTKECTTDGKYTTVSCFVPVSVIHEAIGEHVKQKEKKSLYELIVRGGNRL